MAPQHAPASTCVPRGLALDNSTSLRPRRSHGGSERGRTRHPGELFGENQWFLPPRGDPCDSPQRSGVSKRRSGRAMGRRTAGASNKARMRPHKAAAAIRRFAAEAASGECRARSGRRRPRTSSWRSRMMSKRPAKHIKGDRSSVLLRLAPKSLVFGLFGAISGSESPLTRRIRTPGQLQRLFRPRTHKPRARTPQARWKRPRPHHRRRSRERRDGATPFGPRMRAHNSVSMPTELAEAEACITRRNDGDPVQIEATRASPARCERSGAQIRSKLDGRVAPHVARGPRFFTWTRRSGRPRAMRSAPRAHLHHHAALTPRPDHAATRCKAFCRGQLP